MNEREFWQQYGNHAFFIQVYVEKQKTWLYLRYTNRFNTVGAFNFNQDHQLEFLTPMDYYPDERRWEFDEANQQLVFRDINNTREVSRYNLPTVPDEHQFILTKVGDQNVRYVTSKDFDFNLEVQVPSILSNQRLILISKGRSASTLSKLAEYTKRFSCEYQCLTHAKDPWVFINAAWTAINNDANLKQVCILLTGMPAMDEAVWFKKLTVQTTGKVKLVSGDRAEVIIALAQLLIMHDHQLLAKQEPQSPIKILEQVIIH